MARIAFVVTFVGALLGFVLVQQPGVAQRGLPPQGRGLQIGQDQECPPGMTEIRSGRCQAPEFPAPSIVDYRPRSTLVTVTDTPGRRAPDLSTTVPAILP